MTEEIRKPIILFGDNGDFKIQVDSLGFGVSVENALERDKYMIEAGLNEGLDYFFKQFEEKGEPLTPIEQSLIVQTAKGILAGIVLSKRVVDLKYRKLPESEQKSPKDRSISWS